MAISVKLLLLLFFKAALNQGLAPISSDVTVDVIQELLRMDDRQLLKVLETADRNLLNNAVEQNARSFLGNSSGNEYFSTAAVIESAQLSIKGNYTGVRTMTRVKRQTIVTVAPTLPCVYDLANSQPCSASPFREPTARCTSLTKKTWGMAGTPYTRILFPRYEDGVSDYRVTEFFSGAPLKSPRFISTKVTTTNVFLNADGVSSHTMQWGQFISHEFTLIGEMEANLVCCPDGMIGGYNGGAGGVLQQQRLLTEPEFTFFTTFIRRTRGDLCIPVESQNDSVFGGNICIHQTRSKIAPEHNCVPGPRQQMNMITHVFDGSAVYGSSLLESDDLRTFTGGLLRSQVKGGAKLPPCASPGLTCPFLAGDKRINVTPNLITYHAMFVNVHNKIAIQLSLINPLWDDGRLFQETRRIVAALEANIHFYEYLPIVLGSRIIHKYRLGKYDGFYATVNPSVLNELAGAAMRFGHSTINGIFSLINNCTSQPVSLTASFFDTSRIHLNGIKQCVRGLTSDMPWLTDRNFPTQMRDHLFNQINDIVSLNINRGRDHGFASYLDYRRHYGLSVPANWNDLLFTHRPDVVAALKTVYTTVEDIELYIGGVTENLLSCGLVGETFANILGDGFSRIRKGDRLFFESCQSGLTAAQIASIRQYTLSNLLCDGSDIDKVSSKGFYRIGYNGATEVPCSSLPKLDLSLWKENECTINSASTYSCTGIRAFDAASAVSVADKIL